MTRNFGLPPHDPSDSRPPVHPIVMAAIYVGSMVLAGLTLWAVVGWWLG